MSEMRNNTMHESYPKQGEDNLTSKHGSPSPMHAAGISQKPDMNHPAATKAGMMC